MSKEKKAETITRTLTAVIGFPLIAAILIFANTLILDIVVSIIALISMYEYFKCFKSSGKANPSQFLGYMYCIAIVFINFIDINLVYKIMVIILPVSLLILFIELVLLEGKKTVKDVAISILGIIYVPILISFLSLTRDIDNNINGRILIWFVLIASWGSDVFAYMIGRHFGKHHFTKISPNKTIEGSVAGIIGAVFIGIIYSILCNNLWGTQINYILIGVIVAILSFIGQIGDLAASSIKRYCGIKDYGNIFPGHGGMLDRIDSIIFVIPFAYILLSLL